MDPRSLVGPTLLVFMLLVATVGTLFLLDPVEHKELTPDDYYAMDGQELKKELSKRMGATMYRKLAFYGVIAVLLCVVPMGRTNRITRGLIIAGIGLVGRFVTGDQAGSMSSLMKMSILGVVLIVGLFIINLYGKAVDNGKRPARERWAPPKRDPVLPDDPASLEQLERLRTIAGGPPPTPS